jgi:hypothetical protein
MHSLAESHNGFGIRKGEFEVDIRIRLQERQKFYDLTQDKNAA